MEEGTLRPVFEGDDDSIAGEVLGFAGMSDEFPSADFALLDRTGIMGFAYEHADDWSETEFDSGAPGDCYGFFKFYAKDPDRFRKSLREALFPLCRELVEEED